MVRFVDGAPRGDREEGGPPSGFRLLVERVLRVPGGVAKFERAELVLGGGELEEGRGEVGLERGLVGGEGEVAAEVGVLEAGVEEAGCGRPERRGLAGGSAKGASGGRFARRTRLAAVFGFVRWKEEVSRPWDSVTCNHQDQCAASAWEVSSIPWFHCESRRSSLAESGG